MRIIGGNARGRKLFAPAGSSTAIRPTTDRAREALFNILGEQVLGACVLDLYSGTGALGLEALSRGAKYVQFVDNSKSALKLIHRNISCCTTQYVPPSATQVIKHDLRRGLKLSTKTLPSCCPAFTLVLLDPPYGKGLALKSLEHLDKSIFIGENCMVVAEEFQGVNLPEFFTEQLKLQQSRRYGDSRFWLYTANRNA